MGTYTPDLDFYKPIAHESNYEDLVNLNWDKLDLLHGGVANVMDPQYAGGATGDGVADDTAAFNAARAALPATGGIVYAPPPPVEYLISAALAPYTQFQRFKGAGPHSTRIKFTAGAGAILFTFGSRTDAALTYGTGIKGVKIVMTQSAANAIELAGTAMAVAQDIGIEGVYQNNVSTGIYLNGGVAKNIFSSLEDVLCNHVKYGFVMDQSDADGYVTSVNARNCTAYGDFIAGSRGWDIKTALGSSPNGSGSHIAGGNVEACAQGIRNDGVGITWAGIRLEGNTVDVYTDTNARGNVYFGFQGATTWTDVPSSSTNRRIACTNDTYGELRNSMGPIFSTGDLVLGNVAAGTRYLLSGTVPAPDGIAASTGRLAMQWGAGSAADGGAVLLYGASHASKPGYVVAGLGGAGTRRFEVNEEGLGAGAVVFAADPTIASGETGILVRRNVGGSYSLDRVTMGAADSGGAGYKVLRVPN